jgi:hypothetical protein
LTFDVVLPRHGAPDSDTVECAVLSVRDLLRTMAAEPGLEVRIAYDGMELILR